MQIPSRKREIAPWKVTTSQLETSGDKSWRCRHKVNLEVNTCLQIQDWTWKRVPIQYR